MTLIISFTWPVSVAFLILTGGYAVFPHNCSSGYKADWNACYMVTNKTFTWEDAQRYCQVSHPGADLASIYSETENVAVYAELYKYLEPAWIGLSGINGTGLYNWTDGGSVVYTKWGIDEPFREEGGGCVSMQEDGKWYDGMCEELKKAVCKYTTEPPATQPSLPEGRCPGVWRIAQTWERHNQHCYYFELKEKVSWKTAQIKCKELGGSTASLASIHDMQENRFIQTHVESSHTNTWIGLYRKPDGTYRWNDGSPEQFQRWIPGEPSINKQCTYFSRHWMGKWNNEYCSMHHPFVCKADLVTLPSTAEKVCPGDTNGNQTWEKYKEHCYYFELKERLPWVTAKARCKELGGETASLASVHSVDENNFIKQHVRGASKSPWIGLHQKPDRTTWNWSDESQVRFTYWEHGQPASEEEHCVEYFARETHYTGFWNDAPCSSSRGFVCKTELVEHDEKLGMGKCPDNWFGRGDYCYYFQPNVYETWDTAQTFCKEHHNEATVASVQDHYENTWIQSHMEVLSQMPENHNYWLGLHKTVTDEQKFQWTDNSDFIYHNWAVNEPDNPGYKPCVQVDVDSGQWHSVACTTYRGYVCKMLKESRGGRSGGQTAGIVIGVLLLVVVSIPVLLFLRKRFIGTENLGPGNEELTKYTDF